MGLFAFWLQKTLYFLKFAFDGEKKLQSRQFKSCSPTWLGTEERVSPVYSRSLSNLFETNQKLQNYA